MFSWSPLLILVAVASVVAAPAEPRGVGIDTSYEYIIVGSGPGGGPLAARLALAGKKVLLIDAGDDQRDNIDYQVPAFQARVTQDPLLQWNFYVRQYSDDAKAHKSNKAVWTTPDDSEYTGNQPPEGSTYKGVLYPRAGTLGGCFSHHALISVYPHASDWANLREVTQDTSWDAANMRKYFQKFDRVQYLPVGPGHGVDGYLAEEFTPLQLALEDSKVLAWLYAAAAAFDNIFPGIIGSGISSIAQLVNVLTQDPNRDTPERDTTSGFYQLPLSTNDHARNGPADFIADTIAKGYPLTFLPNTLVTRVNFDNSSGTPQATGVDFLQGQSLYSADPRYNAKNPGIPGSVNATKEVIVSGGTFNTPQILKLSGVGPKEELREFGIPLVVDLPGVGTNMQDRYENAINWKTTSNFTVLNNCTFDYQQPDPCLERWSTNKVDRGTYASDGLVAAAIIKSSVVAQNTSFPNDQDLFIFGGPVNFYGYFPHWDRVAVNDHQHWSWVSLKAHTRNRAGTVKLRSADPRDVPEINFHYYSEGSPGWELDRQAMVEGLQMARLMHEVLPSFITTPFTEVQPGQGGEDLYDYSEINSWGHHASCSCPIGADDDPMAVLDTNFNVRGTKGLRVVDASAFPRIPGTFIAVPTLMLSEKAADVILSGK